MAGKKGVARVQPTTAEDLRAIAQRLRKAAAAVQGVAVALEESGKESADVEGHKMLERAFDSLNLFVANCQKKIREF